jgi:hypothetical protein
LYPEYNEISFLELGGGEVYASPPLVFPATVKAHPARMETSMNSSSAQPNEAPEEARPDSPAPLPPEQLSELVSELKASTPKTLPLKRGETPLFVPAVLPDAVQEPIASEASVSDEPTPPKVEEPAPQPEPVIEPETGEPITEPEVAVAPQPMLPSVEFLPPADAIHRASVTLELRTSEPNASIRYALGAEDVNEDGTLYDPADKIFLTQSTTVAARIFVEGQGGPVTVARFEIVQPGWQKLEPTDQSDPTPHEIHDEATLEGPWRLAAASVRGKLHAHRGAWREDAFRHGLAHASDGTYSVVVVSDGAGSVPLSRVGSNLLCQVALDFLCPALTDSAPLASDAETLVQRDLPPLRALLVEAATLALQKLREEAINRSRPLSDFSSTLLILVRREWNGQQLCAALQSGDGSIALWNDDNTLTLLGEADHGEHSSETRFLTSGGMEAELPARVKFSIRPNLCAVAVMTDGVADDFFPEPVRFPELFNAILPVVEVEGSPGPGAALLNWIGYEKKGSSDDRTLVVCWREATPNSVPAPTDEGGSDGEQ